MSNQVKTMAQNHLPMNPNHKNFLVGLLFMLVGVLFLAVIIPTQIGTAGDFSFGLPPDFFPKIIGWIIVMLSAVFMIQSLLKNRELLQTLPGELQRVSKTIDIVIIRNVVVVFVTCLLYYFLLQISSFIIISPIFIFLLGIFLSLGNKATVKKRIILVFTLAIVTTAVVFYAFEYLLHVKLP